MFYLGGMFHCKLPFVDVLLELWSIILTHWRHCLSGGCYCHVTTQGDASCLMESIYMYLCPLVSACAHLYQPVLIFACLHLLTPTCTRLCLCFQWYAFIFNGTHSFLMVHTWLGLCFHSDTCSRSLALICARLYSNTSISTCG